MEVLDAAAGILAEDEIDGVVQAAVMVFSYLDKDGDERLCVAVSDATMTTRLGLIEYCHARHIREMGKMFDEDAD